MKCHLIRDGALQDKQNTTALLEGLSQYFFSSLWLSPLELQICLVAQFIRKLQGAYFSNTLNFIVSVIHKMRLWPLSLWLRLKTAKRLSQVLSVTDALRIVGRTTHQIAELKVFVHSLQRTVTVRANTSDIDCLEDILVEEEYKLPVEANPMFAVKPAFIIDAGANVGMTTLYFAQQFPQAHIVAIEPEASNFALLVRNCEGLPNLTLRQAALWSEPCSLQINDASVDKWMFSVRPADGGADTIKAVTIPAILQESGRTHIDILKLDIEGAERELFAAPVSNWLPSIKLIIIELHDRFQTGCSEAFYKRVAQTNRPFIQEIRGNSIFLRFLD